MLTLHAAAPRKPVTRFALELVFALIALLATVGLAGCGAPVDAAEADSRAVVPVRTPSSEIIGHVSEH